MKIVHSRRLFLKYLDVRTQSIQDNQIKMATKFWVTEDRSLNLKNNIKLVK